MTSRIYLVPGFFGFTKIGELNYFHRVGSTLEEMLDAHGIDAEVVECTTQPTGSIRKRALRVLHQIEATGGLDADRIHLVGHSTGGLDIRLLATPGVELLEDDREERLGDRLRSVISVATPHFGTPLANFFTTFQGRYMLQILTALATNMAGRYTIVGASMLLQAAAQVDDRLGRDRTMLDTLSERLLSQITVDKNDPLWAFLHEVSSDQGAIIQLTPEGMHLFNAAVTQRPGTRYHCVATAAPPPSLRNLPKLINPKRAASAAIFSSLWRLTSREHSHYPYPSPASRLEADVEATLPFPLTPATNDGIVPTLSQLHGELIMAVVADHLDVVGQFSNAGGNPHSDWLPSGSKFDEARFRRVMKGIADAIAAADA